jgi:hypothetical protein
VVTDPLPPESALTSTPAVSDGLAPLISRPSPGAHPPANTPESATASTTARRATLLPETS